MKEFDVIIIGGGIIGLATAYKLLEHKNNLKLCILEKESRIAKHQTGNNSGVIHSGIYYKPGSMKALNCIRGYRLLLDFCDKEEIHYELCGKVIVACNETEVQRLDKFYERGLENGLVKLKLVDRNKLKEIEPYAEGLKAIHVPYAGIIDFEIVSAKLAEKIQSKEGNIFLYEKVLKVLTGSHNEVETTRGTYKTKGDNKLWRSLLGCLNSINV